MRAPERRRTRGLADELVRAHRFTAVVLVAMLALSLLTSGYLLLVSQPRLVDDIAMTRLAREGHEAMLDQETGLRGWLATGDADFLEPYTAGRDEATRAFDELVSLLPDFPEVTDEVVATLMARQRWQVWASEAARTRLSGAQLTDGTLTDFLVDGKRLFDDYRVADTASLELITQQREAALTLQTRALVAAFVSYVLLLLVVGVLFWRQRREAEARILAPLRSLLETIEAMQHGDLTARSAATDVPELQEIGQQLDHLAHALDQAGLEAARRETRLALLAARLETVVRVGREISGSLSVRYVASTVTSAAAALLGSGTLLWVRGEDQAFHAVHRSEDAHGVVPPADLEAPELVARAAAEARPVLADDSRAYPLVLAGVVTGVLETPEGAPDPDTEQALGALLSTAAAALESARLHSSARELADVDALTQMPNRRRFEVDVDAEWDRCRRYGRPMSLVMLDLDHFKTLNDEHGHLCGDQVLREVAVQLDVTLRTTDTAYRYGGEELVVLLRETGLDDAARCAERMRAAISAIRLEGHEQVSVSTSAGVATRQASMSHHTELVAVADGALYDAKRAGRNRVVTAGAGTVAEFGPTQRQGEQPAPHLCENGSDAAPSAMMAGTRPD